jgi:3-deoxy-manno-octulosonate cytidylyltransferase (CMP-KDO synthetase)
LKIVGVIPVRLASKRFPGKALAKIDGKEMILHVWNRAKSYRRFDKLVVATDDQTIKNLIESKGGGVFYSTLPFANGSERCAACVATIDCDICIDIQGDEVFVTAEQLDHTVDILTHDSNLPVATVAFPITNEVELSDPNLVKVAVDEYGDAIDFSRKPIILEESQITNYGHAGIYAYRREFLLKYAQLAQTPREISESLEQLRILEHGYKIGVAIINKPLISINTPEDLVAANKMLSEERGVM